MPYQYDFSAMNEGSWKPCLAPCEHCGYPEPRDLGPILVWDGAEETTTKADGTRDVIWRSGYRLLACPHCELTAFGQVMT